jgi:hypothetical protein
MVCQLNYTQVHKDSLTNSKYKTKKEGKSYLPYILVLIIFINIILYFIWPTTVLVAEHYPDNNILYYFKVNRNSQIGIIYTHSVEKTETSEWYKIEGDKLILMEQRFKSQGAGLPSDSIYKFEKNEDGYRLYDINLEMDNVIYRTGQIIANHQINIDGKTKEFLTFSKPGDAVIFHVKNISNYEFYRWGCFNDTR